MAHLLAALLFSVPVLAQTGDATDPAATWSVPDELVSHPAPKLAPNSSSKSKLKAVDGPASPSPAPAEDKPMRRIPALFAIGPAVLGISYLTSVVMLFASIKCTPGGYFGLTSIHCGSESASLLIPVVGPWMALGNPNLRSQIPEAIAVDGAFQAIGLSILIAAIFLKVPDEDVDSNAQRSSLTSAGSWSLGPGAPGTPFGVTLDVRFP